MALPDHRIEGAHLSRDSWMHWLYAGIAASLFFSLLTLAFPASRASPQQVLRIGVFTGTIGILPRSSVLAGWSTSSNATTEKSPRLEPIPCQWQPESESQMHNSCSGYGIGRNAFDVIRDAR